MNVAGVAVKLTRYERRRRKLTETHERRLHSKRAPKGSPATRSPQPGLTATHVTTVCRCVYCGGRARPGAVACIGHADLPALEPTARLDAGAYDPGHVKGAR